MNDPKTPSTSLEDLQARIDELESIVGFQERTLGQLDEIVLAFSTRVEALEQQIERLQSKQDEPTVGPHADPPPHY